MFQSYAFQSYAFQTVVGANDNSNGDSGYSYVTPYQKIQAKKREIKRDKTDLEKLESVIKENKRLADIAAKSKQEASKKAAIRLAKLEQQYLEEINRLTQVRAMLMQKARRNEEALILLLMALKRRKRAA